MSTELEESLDKAGTAAYRAYMKIAAKELKGVPSSELSRIGMALSNVSPSMGILAAIALSEGAAEVIQTAATACIMTELESRKSDEVE